MQMVWSTSPKRRRPPGRRCPPILALPFDKKANLLVAELFGTATSESIPAGGQRRGVVFRAKAGDLAAISSDVGDEGTAAITIALEPTAGKFAYVANNLSASVSSDTVGTNGSVTLLAATASAHQRAKRSGDGRRRRRQLPLRGRGRQRHCRGVPDQPNHRLPELAHVG